MQLCKFSKNYLSHFNLPWQISKLSGNRCRLQLQKKKISSASIPVQSLTRLAFNACTEARSSTIDLGAPVTMSISGCGSFEAPGTASTGGGIGEGGGGGGSSFSKSSMMEPEIWDRCKDQVRFSAIIHAKGQTKRNAFKFSRKPMVPPWKAFNI